MAPQTGLEPVTPRLTRRRALRIVRFRDLQSFVLTKAHSLRRSSSPRKVVTFRGPHFFCTRLLQPRCQTEYSIVHKSKRIPKRVSALTGAPADKDSELSIAPSTSLKEMVFLTFLKLYVIITLSS